MKPSFFQALVVVLLLFLLGLVTALVLEVTPMRKELHALAAGRQADAVADAKEDAAEQAAAQARTKQILDRALVDLRKEQAPAPAFHIIPDH
ncbi:hypothetical protein [Burkholderia gladioli]|uniref:hypothetical protein n=1 Tax=Burkholderia gladioli TaxID=28095 RepID=UPI00163F6CDE|nr:hypothetical protein [Burkholderia gladioli]MDN7813798.1 hypothetical protein [Burkholderia gladioli]